MKKVNYLVFGILFLIAASMIMVSASSQQVITPSYSFSRNISTFSSLHSYSFELDINTNSSYNATCKYSKSLMNYANMPYSFVNLTGGSFKATFPILEGIQSYYVKCNSSILKGSEPPYLLVKVDPPVSAIVDIPAAASLTGSQTLSSGRFRVNLTTTKPIQQDSNLNLEYSFDGSSWSPLPLYPGSQSGTNWYSYLVIPSNAKSGFVDFKFSADDLNGIEGTQITSGGSFPIDTQKPLMIGDINAVGATGHITLNWYPPTTNNIVKYNIYRSTSPGVDYTDYYTSCYVNSGSCYSNLNGDLIYYTDYGAVQGKTYYYKVAAVDGAGNIADLSQEVYSTSLNSNVTVNTTTGLSPSLVGNVENFLISADSVISSIDNIKASLSNQSQTEQKLFTDLGFETQLDSTINQINAIKRDAKALELQDLTQQQLTNQLDALNVKLGIAERQAPEDLTILSNDSSSYTPTENDVIKALLEYNSSMSQSEISSSSKASMDYIKSSGMKINSRYYDIQVVYLDGTTQDYSVVSRTILGQVSPMSDAYFVENIPKSVASSVSSVNFPLGSYTTLQSDPIVSFGSDTKNIVYYIQGDESLQTLEGTSVSFMMLANQSSGFSLTGSIVKGISTGFSFYGGIIVGVLVLAGLLIYFLVLKKRKLSDKAIESLGMIREINDYISDGDFEKSKSMYKELRDKYKEFKEGERKMLYRKIRKIYEKLLEAKQEDKKNEQNGPKKS